jgi:D-threo-aldose 1-dehydrogenase
MIDWRQTVPVGDTDLRLPRIGLGTAALGNFLQAMSDEDAIGVIRHALEAGVKYIDTAPLYGHGLAERRIAAAIAGVPRDQLILSTKVGRLLREGAPRDESQYHDGRPFYQDVPSAGPIWDFSVEGIRASVAESTDRVGVERFDILHLHDPDDHFPAASTTGYQGVAALRSRGEVTAIGAGMNRTEVQTQLVRACALDIVLCAGRYTLLDQSALDELLPACEVRGVSVVVGGVFNSGVLVDPSPGALYDYVPADREVIERARAIQRVCERHGVPLPAAALQFPLSHPRVASVLLGPRTVAELDGNLKLLAIDIPDALWGDLAGEGLIRGDAPLPTMMDRA